MLRRTVADLEAVAPRQRVLCDVSAIDLSTKIFGQQALRFALAPIGLAGMHARRAEIQVARAAPVDSNRA